MKKFIKVLIVILIIAGACFGGYLYISNRVKKNMLDKNPDLRGMYSEFDDNTIVLYFKHAKATISSFTEAPKVIEF